MLELDGSLLSLSLRTDAERHVCLDTANSYQIKDPPECATMAYTKYAAYLGWTGRDGKRMPSWEALPPNEQAAWRIVEQHVRTDVKRERQRLDILPVIQVGEDVKESSLTILL